MIDSKIRVQSSLILLHFSDPYVLLFFENGIIQLYRKNQELLFGLYNKEISTAILEIQNQTFLLGQVDGCHSELKIIDTKSLEYKENIFKEEKDYLNCIGVLFSDASRNIYSAKYLGQIKIFDKQLRQIKIIDYQQWFSCLLFDNPILWVVFDQRIAGVHIDKITDKIDFEELNQTQVYVEEQNAIMQPNNQDWFLFDSEITQITSNKKYLVCSSIKGFIYIYEIENRGLNYSLHLYMKVYEATNPNLGNIRTLAFRSNKEIEFAYEKQKGFQIMKFESGSDLYQVIEQRAEAIVCKIEYFNGRRIMSYNKQLPNSDNPQEQQNNWAIRWK